MQVVNDRCRAVCTCGGVQVTDLQGAIVPRRHRAQEGRPTINKYVFVPNNEPDMAAAHVGGQSVVAYARVCNAFATAQLAKTVANETKNGLKNRELTRRLLAGVEEQPAERRDDEDEYASGESASNTLYRTLRRMFAVKHDERFAKNIDAVMSSSAVDLVTGDRLFSFARSDRCFKACLDVVLENADVEIASAHVQVRE